MVLVIDSKVRQFSKKRSLLNCLYFQCNFNPFTGVRLYYARPRGKHANNIKVLLDDTIIIW